MTARQPIDFNARATKTGQPDMPASEARQRQVEDAADSDELAPLHAEIARLKKLNENMALELAALKQSDDGDKDAWKQRAETAEAKLRLAEAVQPRYQGKNTLTFAHRVGENDDALTEYLRNGWAVRFEQFIIGGDDAIMHCVRLYKNQEPRKVAPVPKQRVIGVGDPVSPAIVSVSSIKPRQSRDPAVLDRQAMQKAKSTAQVIRAQRKQAVQDGS